MIEGTRLLREVTVSDIRGELPARVMNLCADSRHVKPGHWFVALRGTTADGHKFLGDAAAKGAVAAIVDTADPGVSIPQVVVPNTLAALPTLAANFYQHPADRMVLAGVTGSNGKTSSTYLLEAVWKAADIDCGVIGTIEYRWGGHGVDAPNTTPLAHDLHHTLFHMEADGIQHVVLEVSSHALELHRVDGLAFAAALFTNLSHDHLDFHPTMEAYRAAKMRLFTEHLAGLGAINLDDEQGRIVYSEIDSDTRLSYAIDRAADVRAEDVHLDRESTRFRLASEWGTADIRSNLLGRHNLENVLGVCALALALELPLDAIAEGIAALPSVPGRLEVIENDLGATILVDYAHTPDGLDKVLTTTSKLPHNRLICLMGCGGDRDRTKRPEMGAFALKHSDRVIVTSDNPRTEDPETIIRDITTGMTSGQDRYQVEPDRREAIRRGLQSLEPGDIFVIAGKGHETYQLIGTTKHPFDDRAVTRAMLAEMRDVR